jgi:plasmid maintenance system antidote protein VapI
MRLERLLGTSAESWLHMQEAVDLWEARQQPERFSGIKRLSSSARNAGAMSAAGRDAL